jgi:hypothetical protein
MTVAFGASGQYKYATLADGTACTDGVFGDPLYGTAKACYLAGAPPAATTWTQCAAENATCSFAGTREVAFGASGRYRYGTFTGGTPCTDGVFGDPLYGTAKACYVQ